MTAKLAVALSIVACVALHAGLVSAAERHPSVALEIGACLDVEQAEVRRIVAIELRALMIGSDSAEPITRVAVDCYNPLVEIRVEDPVTGKSLVRRIDLSTSERSIRARLLALASPSWSHRAGPSWIRTPSRPSLRLARPPRSASVELPSKP